MRGRRLLHGGFAAGAVRDVAGNGDALDAVGHFGRGLFVDVERWRLWRRPAASARALAAPRPDAPPVTMAACPLISISAVLRLRSPATIEALRRVRPPGPRGCVSTARWLIEPLSVTSPLSIDGGSAIRIARSMRVEEPGLSAASFASSSANFARTGGAPTISPSDASAPRSASFRQASMSGNTSAAMSSRSAPANTTSRTYGAK